MEENNASVQQKIGKRLFDILKKIKEGYKKELGIDIDLKQASDILALKIDKAGIDFKFP